MALWYLDAKQSIKAHIYVYVCIYVLIYFYWKWEKSAFMRMAVKNEVESFEHISHQG